MDNKLSKAKIDHFRNKYKILFKWANPGLFFNLVLFFPSLELNNAVASGIRTQIVRVEGKDADHNTTITAPL